MRTLIALHMEQVQKLKSLCRKLKISRAEAVRRAVDEYLQKLPGVDDPSAAFGIWQGKFKDALSYERKLRDEWDRK